MKPAYQKINRNKSYSSMEQIKTNYQERDLLIKSLKKIDNFLPQNGDKELEKKILSDLTSSPKKISCVFFYDSKGSKLFEEITKLPEYYLTRTEIDLLNEAIPQISDKLRDIDIVEFGSGDCTKISILLETIPEELRDTICYVPVDVSIAAVEKSSNILLNKFPGIRIYGIVADFISQLDVIPKDRKKVICFLGSTIGNLPMDEAMQFLVDLNEIMQTSDLLLLGLDMVKNKEILDKAYNDSKNVTERFNKNILNVINSYIGTNFDPDNFEHIAFYNERFSRIEMHLKAVKDLEIICPRIPTNISIKKGETIHTENSYKFTNENIERLASGADLEIQNIFTDENKWFSLVQLIKN
ncbi:MAG: L-histidine N(alpha)-methyltransferase [Thermoplasmatales archaeon]|nr:MAG: L-histidine N(alpha)-methyltransferase [Thermoplasmatales archaeon]